jgi:hypothetical protein
MKSGLDIILERGYWISQITLMVLALGTAIVAFRQLQTYKLFELLKILESPEFRAARRVVLCEIYERKESAWWNDPNEGERLSNFASDVCAGYDILGRMIEYDSVGRIPRYGRFFRRHWARSIITNHDALKGYLEHRRHPKEGYPGTYSAFTDLAVAAEREAGPMNPPN